MPHRNLTEADRAALRGMGRPDMDDRYSQAEMDREYDARESDLDAEHEERLRELLRATLAEEGEQPV